MNQTTQRTPKLYRFSDLRDRKVFDNSGEEVGTVQDLFLDDEEQEARYLEVRAGGFLDLDDREKGELMGFNPVDADVHKYLAGASYPASGGELASAAQSNDAPDAVVEELRNLSNERFAGPGEVRAALVARVSRRERARLLRRPG